MKRNHWLVQFILDGLTAVTIVGGLMLMYWMLSTLPMHRGH
jgi:hypothetical protein